MWVGGFWFGALIVGFGVWVDIGGIFCVFWVLNGFTGRFLDLVFVICFGLCLLWVDDVSFW